MIATENGWNLYLCGNGGMRPRHAELFATDLDDETLIRYIDRFLMLYIRTADKLQRTSVWRESLEGGLDYLKAVIVDDSLGLAAELESQMQLVVDRYECEWANALKDPEKLKRFRTFVNDGRGDPDVHFVRSAPSVVRQNPKSWPLSRCSRRWCNEFVQHRISGRKRPFCTATALACPVRTQGSGRQLRRGSVAGRRAGSAVLPA